MPRGHAPSYRSEGKRRQDCPPSNFCPSEFGPKASFHHWGGAETGPEKGSDLPRATQSRAEPDSLEGPALPPAQLRQPTGTRGQELEGGRGESRQCQQAVLLFPVTVPQRGSLTRVCGSAHSSGRTALRRPTATAVPSLLGPEHGFQPEAPLRAARVGSGPGSLIFGIHVLLGVLRREPEDVLVALRGVVRIQAQVSASGCRLALAPCRHPSG